MSGIVDEGSLLFAAIAVLVVSCLPQASGLAALEAVFQGPVVGSHPPHARGADRPGRSLAADDEAPLPDPRILVLTRAPTTELVSGIFSVGGLGLFFVPALILVMTLLDRQTGSFGVALPRDWGSLAPCALMAWAAAHLPFGLLALALASSSAGGAGGLSLALVGLTVVGPALGFAALMTLAARTVYGAAVGRALLAVVLAALALPFAGFLAVLASPFVLYWAYIFFRSDITAIQWSMGSRRSFKRHLEAAGVEVLT